MKIHKDIKDDYISEVVENIKINSNRKIKIVIDCGNGAAGCIAPALYKKLGCEVIELFSEIDGNFPNHHPDPGKLENLKDRTLYLKDPWSNRDGYVLNSLVFLITKPPTEKELELEKSIDTVETDVKEMQDIVKKLVG